MEEKTIETPVEAPDEQAPVEGTQEGAESGQEVEEQGLYELPDGTKVDAETLQKEFAENFYPEFTRRSQELAAFKKGAQEPETQQPTKAPWEEDPDWAPQSYNDLANPLAEQIERGVWERIKQEAEAEQNAQIERAEAIRLQIEEIQKIDPDVDPNKVISHAAKYQFNNLHGAWQNMRVIEDAMRTAEKRAAQNVAGRAKGPVSTSGAPTGNSSQPPKNLRTGYDKALWALKNQD